MYTEWLTKRVTIEEAETAETVRVKKLGSEPIPFGLQHKQWTVLVKKMREGDELWEFHSPPNTWKSKCGSAGYAVLRKGKVVDHIITLMN